MFLPKKITIDLNKPTKNVFHVGQGDNSREVHLVLLADGVPYDVTDGVTGTIAKSVKYLKPNNVGGEYTTTNGESAVELVENTTNEYIVRLDENATNVPGFTEIFVTFTKGNHVLHSFPITLDVGRIEASGTSPDDPHFTVFLRKDAQATKTNAMTEAVGVDSNGKLWSKPGSGSGADLPELTYGDQGKVLMAVPGSGSTLEWNKAFDVPYTITITQSGSSYVSNQYHTDIQARVTLGKQVCANTPEGKAYYYDADASGSLFYVLCRIGDAMSSVEYHVTSNAVSREVFTIDNETKLAVLYGSAMSLGASQKLQARTNIDAAETVTVVTSSDSTATITPTANHQYIFSSPILSLEISSGYAATGDWSVEFDAPTNVGPSVTLPSGLKTNPASPSFAANKHYEINCHNGYAVVAEW